MTELTYRPIHFITMPNTPTNNLRRDRYLSWLKPFYQLDIVQRASVSLWKKAFQKYDHELRDCLNVLAVPQLEPYLVWIPHKKLFNFHQLAEGGFAKVFRANIYASEWHDVAAKELNDTMVAEVRSYHCIYCFFYTTCYRNNAVIYLHCQPS